MDIILLQDLEKVGSKFEIVTVKNGYGRNYLIPQGIAEIANDTNRRKLDEYKRKEMAKETAELRKYQVIAEAIQGKVLKIGAKAGTTGKIFGSVTNVQIAAALVEQLKVEIDRRKIVLPDEVKTIGTYTAILDLHSDVDAKVDFEVVQE
ncbi:MAG: 50S ribosomal protein L9 [Bacteroidetes bacterium]|nr:50S ribosomal protein L9 [Bacteroidota bacterium]